MLTCCPPPKNTKLNYMEVLLLTQLFYLLQVVHTVCRQKFEDVKDNIYLMDRKYKICFENESVQMSYKDLLQHSCPICNNDDERHRSNLRDDGKIGSHIFQTFKQLEQHVRRSHEMFYCDLCAEHLKVTHSD